MYLKKMIPDTINAMWASIVWF